MDDPARLFHLHFAVPDVPAAERALADAGLPPYRRFGRLDGERASLDADEPVPDGFRLRLQNARTGAVDVTLAPGTRLQFDHLGVVVPDVAAVVDRAEDVDWSARDSGGRRSFLATPWRFRVEVVDAAGAVAGDLGSPDVASLASVALRVPDPDRVRSAFETVLGDLPALRFEDAGGDRASIPRFRLDGSAFPGGRTVSVPDALSAPETT